MSTKARVRILVEVSLASAWGDMCTMGQVRDQSTRDALDAVRKSLGLDSRLRIVEAVATDIIVTEEKP
jgi:hypothetical protein